MMNIQIWNTKPHLVRINPSLDSHLHLCSSRVCVVGGMGKRTVACVYVFMHAHTCVLRPMLEGHVCCVWRCVCSCMNMHVCWGWCQRGMCVFMHARMRVCCIGHEVVIRGPGSRGERCVYSYEWQNSYSWCGNSKTLRCLTHPHCTTCSKNLNDHSS